MSSRIRMRRHLGRQQLREAMRHAAKGDPSGIAALRFHGDQHDQDCSRTLALGFGKRAQAIWDQGHQGRAERLIESVVDDLTDQVDTTPPPNPADDITDPHELAARIARY